MHLTIKLSTIIEFSFTSYIGLGYLDSWHTSDSMLGMYQNTGGRKPDAMKQVFAN